MVLSNRAYDLLKNVVLVVLPALATFYTGLGQLWHFPEVPEVVGTIGLLTTLLGIFLKVTTRQYNKTDGAPDGDLLVHEVDGEKFLALGANKPIEHLTAKDSVRFRVVDNSAHVPEHSADASQ